MSTVSKEDKRKHLKKSSIVVPTQLGPEVKHVILHTNQTKGLALSMMACDSTVKLGLGSIKWDRFEDGFPNLFICNVEDLRGRDVIFLADFLHHGSLFDQLSGNRQFRLERLTVSDLLCPQIFC